MSLRFGMAAAFGAAFGAVALAGAALAHDDMGPAPTTPGGKAAAARHQNFKQLGGSFKAINDQLKKGKPDKAVVSANAQKMNALSRQLPGWFPKGSGPESGVKMEAKANIWSDPQGFAAAAQKFQAETGKLQQLAAAGDMDALKAQVRATGGACKGCHDKFRQEDKD